jgi:diaminopimelate epimerase
VLGFPFHKMEACGNDFVVVYRSDLPPDANPALAVSVCDRHFGVGADGVLVVGVGANIEPSALRGQAAVSMTVWNADGSVAEMCGNGLRCVVRRVLDDRLWSPPPDHTGLLAAATGLVPFRLVGNLVRVRLSPPRITADIEEVEVDGRRIRGLAVDMGNPHFVVFDHAQEQPLPDLRDWAPALAVHSRFPDRTNVEHVRVHDGEVHVRVWERGVGETLACGSGACAVAAATRVTGRSDDDPVTVLLPGGALSVFWSGRPDDGMDLQGPARSVFTGTYAVNRGSET